MKVRKLANPYIPDDLIQDILSRLPAICAVRCRFVCRRWRELTFDTDFVDSQFTRNSNIPSVLVAYPETNSGLDLFELEKWWDPAEYRLTDHRLSSWAGKFDDKSWALFSHAGIVAFRVMVNNSQKFIIINPISRENVTITLSKDLYGSEMYGVYFHPSLKEYCSLWMIRVPHDRTEPIQYKMLSLGSNPSLKKLNNPYNKRLFKDVFLYKGSYYYKTHPLLINKYLYWMLEYEQRQGPKYSGRNDIMKFNFISEQFMFVPCPVPLNTECSKNQTHLLNIDGVLSYLLTISNKITIWRLKDDAKVFGTAAEYTFNRDICPHSLELKEIVIIGAKGKLALFSQGRRLLVCNLMDGTVETNQNKKYSRNATCLSHQISLASLRKCRPTICINEYGAE